jgi:hypothetical protein
VGPLQDSTAKCGDSSVPHTLVGIQVSSVGATAVHWEVLYHTNVCQREHAIGATRDTMCNSMLRLLPTWRPCALLRDMSVINCAVLT